MKRYFPLLILFTCSFIFSCQNENINIWYSYNETQCADAWETGIGSDESVVLESVENHLASLGISVVNVELNNNGIPEICLACTCHSGRIIRVLSSEIDEEILLEEGFSPE